MCRILDEVAISQVSKLSFYYFDHVKYPYSAAAVAIRFLQSLLPTIKPYVREIVLNHDWESVAGLECDGRGFIPFCLENRKLWIVRYVNLWQNAFLIDITLQQDYIWSPNQFGNGAEADMHSPAPDDLKDDKLTANAVTGCVGTRTVECHLLPSLGMPQGSYTLVLDG